MRVVTLGRGGVDQRQTQRIVRRLVPAVLAVVENRERIGAVGVGQRRPLVARHLVGRVGVVAADQAGAAQVVDRLRIAHRGGELGLEQRIAGVPVDRIAHVDALLVGTVGQRHVLHELRIAAAPLHPERRAHGTPLGDRDPHVLADRTARLVQRLLEDLPCGPVVRGVALDEREAERGVLGDQFASHALVDQRHDVAGLIEPQTVDAVFERAVRHPQRRRRRRSGRTHVVDGITHRSDLGHEGNLRPVAVAAQDLHGRTPSVGPAGHRPLRRRSERHLGLDDRPAAVGDRIV